MNDEDRQPYEDLLWNTLLGEFHCACYDGGVDLDVLNVVECIANDEKFFCTHIAEKLNLQEHYVQMIQYLICGPELAEYGTSPRGCWLTTKGKDWFEKLKPYHAWLRSPEESDDDGKE